MLSSISLARPKNTLFSLAAFLTFAVAITIAYGRSVNTPFVFDDLSAVKKNPSIVHLWPLIGSSENPGPLNAPKDWTTAGRPLVNLTLALNYRFGELDPVGYHLFNLAVHFLSTVLVWLIVRRTLQLEYFAKQFDEVNSPLAFLTALLWTVHPLQSETVVYVSQRTELMVALFYLATLYSSMRYWETTSATGKRTWLALALLCSCLGMACKEVMVTAPVVILLFERTFLAGSFREAVKRSWPLYVGLAASWLLLLALNFDQPRASTAGFNLEITPLHWWCIQAKVLWLYFKLVVWPWPLSIHYAMPPMEAIGAYLGWIVATTLACAGTIVLIWRKNSIGFVGAWVLSILSPTLVVPIVTEVAAERRMYLPLAAIMPSVVAGGYWLTRQAVVGTSSANGRSPSYRRSLCIIAPVAAFLVMVWSLLDIRRISAFQNATTLWQDTVKSQPDDSMAHYNLGSEYVNAGRQEEAIKEFRRALEIKPTYFRAQLNLASSLFDSSRIEEAVEQYQRAIQLGPTIGTTYVSLGVALLKLGRTKEALAAFESAVKYAPDCGPAHRNLGTLLLITGKPRDAIVHFEAALELEPDQRAETHQYLANAFLGIGETAEALQHLHEALRLQPDSAEIHETMAIALAKSGRLPEAIEQFQKATELDQNNAEDYMNLAVAYAQTNQFDEAIVSAEKAANLARSQANAELIQKTAGLLQQYRTTQKASPDNPKSEIELPATGNR